MSEGAARSTGSVGPETLGGTGQSVSTRPVVLLMPSHIGLCLFPASSLPRIPSPAPIFTPAPMLPPAWCILFHPPAGDSDNSWSLVIPAPTPRSHFFPYFLLHLTLLSSDWCLIPNSKKLNALFACLTTLLPLSLFFGQHWSPFNHVSNDSREQGRDPSSHGLTVQWDLVEKMVLSSKFGTDSPILSWSMGAAVLPFTHPAEHLLCPSTGLVQCCPAWHLLLPTSEHKLTMLCPALLSQEEDGLRVAEQDPEDPAGHIGSQFWSLLVAQGRGTRKGHTLRKAKESAQKHYSSVFCTSTHLVGTSSSFIQWPQVLPEDLLHAVLTRVPKETHDWQTRSACCLRARRYSSSDWDQIESLTHHLLTNCVASDKLFNLSVSLFPHFHC
jgi:hypothetical protein